MGEDVTKGIRDIWIANILSVLIVGAAVLAVVGDAFGWWVL